MGRLTVVVGVFKLHLTVPAGSLVERHSQSTSSRIDYDMIRTTVPLRHVSSDNVDMAMIIPSISANLMLVTLLVPAPLN